MLATLIFAGVRLGELLELRWRDVDLAAGRLTVRGTKTDQAERRVKIRGALRDELLAIRASGTVPLDGGAFLFPTSSGERFGQDNFRNRVMAGSVRDANKALQGAGQAPLPERITPHSLRRTFASLLYALGESPPLVMAEMGHADPSLALRIYAQAMGRDEAERSKLRGLVEGAEFLSIDVDESQSTQTRGWASR
jgi:integrase